MHALHRAHIFAETGFVHIEHARSLPTRLMYSLRRWCLRRLCENSFTYGGEKVFL